MNILFLVPYPLQKSPSQRFRFEQYFGGLTESGNSYSVQSFASVTDYKYLFGDGNAIRKLWVIVKGFLKRTVILSKLSSFDFVFIHRELSPVGPPVFEWIISKIFRKKIIYDFDDAIWLTDRQHEPIFIKTLRWRTKVFSICKFSYKVSAGNKFLCNYALQNNQHVVLNPTTIDTSKIVLQPSSTRKNQINVGWTGSHSTLKYLIELETVLQKLESKYSHVNFIVIADKKPELLLQRMSFIPWKLETEIDDLRKIDIGIMPLPDNEWTQGKCGFKILQYMALRIPAVASPVGVNGEIIKQKENGFLCSTPQEWFDALSMLIESESLRDELGLKGEKLVNDFYSTTANSSNFIALFT